jgi:hypothetical protein
MLPVCLAPASSNVAKLVHRAGSSIEDEKPYANAEATEM